MGQEAGRPASVAVIGWLFIAVTTLLILSSFTGLMSFLVVGRVAPIAPPSLPAEAPWPAGIVPAMFDYLGLLCGLQLLVAIFVLVAAIQFLRLRAWARTALEVVTWLQLAYTVGFGLLWVGAWASIAPDVAAGGDLPVSAGALTVVGVAMGIGLALVFAVPCAVIIWVLRGEPVRRAMIV